MSVTTNPTAPALPEDVVWAINDFRAAVRAYIEEGLSLEAEHRIRAALVKKIIEYGDRRAAETVRGISDRLWPKQGE